MSVNSSNPSSPNKDNFESANPNYHDYFGSSDVDADVSGIDSHFSLEIDNDEISSQNQQSIHESTGNSTDNFEEANLLDWIDKFFAKKNGQPENVYQRTFSGSASASAQTQLLLPSRSKSLTQNELITKQNSNNNSTTDFSESENEISKGSLLGYTPDVSDYSSDSDYHLQPSKSNDALNLSSPVYDSFQLSEDYANPMDYFDKNLPEIGQSSPIDYQSSSENYFSEIDSGSESDTGDVDPDQALQSLRALLSQYDNP
ncbi:hypothetical protein AYI69_g4836 [Smittium culicis]|uniref:Uncharacterized protein n=1 Tax=Smittium culicis TaxID=133412 RepID=A0A1R1YAD1_9FUNG|nr:hypothetical protein AYI69_g4836 [Smittium culicis]